MVYTTHTAKYSISPKRSFFIIMKNLFSRLIAFNSYKCSHLSIAFFPRGSNPAKTWQWLTRTCVYQCLFMHACALCLFECMCMHACALFLWVYVRACVCIVFVNIVSAAAILTLRSFVTDESVSRKRWSKHPLRYSKHPLRYSKHPLRYSKHPLRYSKHPLRYSKHPSRHQKHIQLECVDRQRKQNQTWSKGRLDDPRLRDIRRSE